MAIWPQEPMDKVEASAPRLFLSALGYARMAEWGGPSNTVPENLSVSLVK